MSNFDPETSVNVTELVKSHPDARLGLLADFAASVYRKGELVGNCILLKASNVGELSTVNGSERGLVLSALAGEGGSVLVVGFVHKESADDLRACLVAHPPAIPVLDPELSVGERRGMVREYLGAVEDFERSGGHFFTSEYFAHLDFVSREDM